jgi:hypothetical protein
LHQSSKDSPLKASNTQATCSGGQALHGGALCSKLIKIRRMKIQDKSTEHRFHPLSTKWLLGAVFFITGLSFLFIHFRGVTNMGKLKLEGPRSNNNLKTHEDLLQETLTLVTTLEHAVTKAEMSAKGSGKVIFDLSNNTLRNSDTIGAVRVESNEKDDASLKNAITTPAHDIQAHVKNSAPFWIKDLRNQLIKSRINSTTIAANTHDIEMSTITSSSSLMEPKLDVAITTTASTVDGIDKEDQLWYEQLTRKLRCIQGGRAAFYLYHVRKAAGTTLRDIMTTVTRNWRLRMLETEGPTLNSAFLDLTGLISVITLREPVSRVTSLYWYEHVGWFDGVLHKTGECKPFMEWVQGWRDGAVWKSSKRRILSIAISVSLLSIPVVSHRFITSILYYSLVLFCFDNYDTSS